MSTCSSLLITLRDVRDGSRICRPACLRCPIHATAQDVRHYVVTVFAAAARAVLAGATNYVEIAE